MIAFGQRRRKQKCGEMRVPLCTMPQVEECPFFNIPCLDLRLLVTFLREHVHGPALVRFKAGRLLAPLL